MKTLLVICLLICTGCGQMMAEKVMPDGSRIKIKTNTFLKDIDLGNVFVDGFFDAQKYKGVGKDVNINPLTGTVETDTP